MYQHVLQKIVLTGDHVHPIGKAILQAVDKYKSFLHDWQLSTIYKTWSHEDFTDKLHTLRADIAFVSNLIAMGFKLTFPAFAMSERLVGYVRRVCKDIIVSRLYPTLFAMCATRATSDTQQHRIDAAFLLQLPVTAETLGLRPVFFQALQAPGALQTYDMLSSQFCESASLRRKFQLMEGMFTALCDVVVSFWKKADAASSSSSSSSSSTHHEDMKYVIGADDLLPILVYALIRATPDDLHAHLACMTELSEDHELLGKAGYVVASLQTALHVVASMASAQRSSSKSSSAALVSPATDSTTKTSTATDHTSASRTTTPSTPAIPIKPNLAATSGGSGSGSGASGTPSNASPSTATASPASADPLAPGSQHEEQQIITDDDSWIFNEFIAFSATDMDAEHSYNLSLKLFSLVVCIYERYSKLLVTHVRHHLNYQNGHQYQFRFGVW